MYAMADRYEISDLKDLARTKFEVAVRQDWNSQAFACAAEQVFESTLSSDQGLRSIVVTTIDQHRELVTCDEFRNLLHSGNAMVLVLIQVLLLGHVNHG